MISFYLQEPLKICPFACGKLVVRQDCGNLANLYLNVARCHWALKSLHLHFLIVFLVCELFIMASETLGVPSCDKKLLAILETLAKAYI